MDKQAKEPDLFNQVLAIAMKEGKLQFSKDADPSQSGVVGEKFLLFSRQRKLLISIPLEKLKRNTLNTNSDQKAKANNGCLKGCGCFGGVLVILVMLIPSFTSIKTIPYAPMAMNIIANLAKECAVKKANGERNPKFGRPSLTRYEITPANGDCNGDENNLITAQSIKTTKYPNYSYNVETGEKTCSHDGPSEQLHGCSARKNGEW